MPLAEDDDEEEEEEVEDEDHDVERKKASQSGNVINLIVFLVLAGQLQKDKSEKLRHNLWRFHSQYRISILTYLYTMLVLRNEKQMESTMKEPAAE